MIDINFKEPTENDIKNKLSKTGIIISIGKNNDKLYRVCRIEDCVHTYGGKYALNDYYAYPIDEEPSLDNIIEYDGELPVSYTISKYNVIDKHGITSTVHGEIFVNGKKIYEENANDVDYLSAKIKCDIVNLFESTPIDFYAPNYKTKWIGKEIYYHDQRAVITDFTDDNCFIIKPVFGLFEKPISFSDWTDQEWKKDYGYSLKVDILSDAIDWYVE